MDGREGGREDGVPRVVLYGRAGCHLCAAARDVVREVCAATGERWREVDVDDPAAAPDGRDLVAELGELVPVVEVDGVRQGYWRIDADRLRRALVPPRA
ncbi:thioredoxin family protein [Cellulomonas marina]|uniref:Glutaredoxin-like domain n=1 Tax=Cellulomonas marina TaxID=988821 RepID=A0A1I0XL91_9CELL|nr:thioredoxin family protein [Cellulomonas marina]SFB00733.1 Glutaredoxin-like domain [Cellulomonas marina]